jgi:adenylate cyclase
MREAKTRSIPLVLKLSMLISLLVIGGISVLSVSILGKQHQLQSEQVQDFGNGMVLQLASSATEPLFTDDMLSLQLMVNNFVKLPRVVGAAVIDKRLNILAQERLPGKEQFIRSSIANFTFDQDSNSEIRDDGSMSVIGTINFRKITGGYVYIEMQTESLLTAYTRTLTMILLVSGLVVILTLVLAYLISRHFSRPITQLLNATTQIGEGRFDVKVDDRRNDELGRLISAINDMGEGLYQKTQVESLMSQFLAKDVADEFMGHLDTVKIGGERVTATVLFADIVGFTSMSEQLTPEAVAEFLNEYFSYFTMCANLYFGSVDKFIGDCAMVVFGAPKPDTDHQFHAVECAVLMQKLNRKLNIARQQEGLAAVDMRIGINSGQMLAGVLGTSDRMEYTVVGDSVNLASRLCGEASAGEIVITHETYASLFPDKKVIAHVHKKIRIRGKVDPVETYIIDDVAREHQLTMEGLINDVLTGRMVK